MLIFFLFCVTAVFSQKDSLHLGDKYLEDQLYFNVTYNQLYDQPQQVKGSGFSYGIAAGYIKDISLIKSGKLALGLGIGYAFDSFNHGLKLSKVNNEVIFEANSNISSNELKIHSFEVPFEIRWRTSTANRYKFWRVYTGVKLSYNLSNTFLYESTSATNITTTEKFSDVNRFNKLQYGLTLSTGYAAFNFHVYYGLTPMLKGSSLGTSKINTKILKMGFIFYIL